MRPLEISLSGFGPYRDPQTVDLSKIHQACVTGPNGAGKSTLLTNALSFALFGPRRGATDRIVNKQSDIATVSLVFEHGEEKWKLTRTRVRGKQTDADLAREVDGEGPRQAKQTSLGGYVRSGIRLNGEGIE